MAEYRRIAKRLYARISKIKADRVKMLLRGGTEELKHLVAETIRDRTTGQLGGARGAVNQLKAATAKGKVQTLPYETIRDWVHGEVSEEDPLALPYRLTMERFFPDDGEPLEHFDTKWQDVRISHRSPVQIPDTSQAIKPEDQITRSDCIVLKRIFLFCRKQGRFRINASEVGSILANTDIHPSTGVMNRLVKALEAVAPKPGARRCH